MFHSHMDTGSYTFDGYGESMRSSEFAVLAGYLRHMDASGPRLTWTANQRSEFGRALTTVSKLADYFGIRTVAIIDGHCYRDMDSDLME